MDFSHLGQLGLGGLIGASPYSSNVGGVNSGQQQRSSSSNFPSPTAASSVSQSPGLRIPKDIIEDLVIRFTMNIPEEEREPTRVCFQIELAHWFFVDHYCSENADIQMRALGHIRFQDFAALMFQGTPYLKQHVKNIDLILSSFKEYKQKVPTYGAILMNADLSHVVLVQSFGGHWGFPKGKVNKDEDAASCAVREVKEETGYDIAKLMNTNHFIESEANDRKSRLYIIKGVETNFAFRPETQYEIKNIAWFGLEELPENKKDPNVVSKRGYSNNNFFPVYTYVRRLKRWVADKLEGKHNIPCFRSSLMSRFPYDSNLYDPNSQGVRKSTNRMESLTGLMKPIGTPLVQLQGLPSGQNSANRNFQQQEQNPMLPVNYGNQAQYTVRPNSPKIVQPSPALDMSRSLPLGNTIPVSTTKPRNPKRRLFVDDTDPLPVSKASPSQKQIQKPQGASIYDLLSAPAWLNFQFDREPIIRALTGE